MRSLRTVAKRLFAVVALGVGLVSTGLLLSPMALAQPPGPVTVTGAPTPLPDGSGTGPTTSVIATLPARPSPGEETVLPNPGANPAPDLGQSNGPAPDVGTGTDDQGPLPSPTPPSRTVPDGTQPSGTAPTPVATVTTVPPSTVPASTRPAGVVPVVTVPIGTVPTGLAGVGIGEGPAAKAATGEQASPVPVNGSDASGTAWGRWTLALLAVAAAAMVWWRGLLRRTRGRT